MASISALLSAFPDRDLAKVSVQEFVTRLSHPHDPHQKGNLKIGDERRPLQFDILLCAGLCLGEETINGHEVTIGYPREAVEDLLTSIFGKPTAVLEVLKSRPKLSEVKEACFDLPVLFLPEYAALRRRLDLETKLKTAEACRMSTCDSKSQSHLECMKTWKDVDEILRRICEDLSPAEKEERVELVKCMKVEVVGFHYYMIFLHLQFALRIHMSLNTFEIVLDACEAAYVKLEKEFSARKALKRKGLPLHEPTDKKIAGNFKPQTFEPISCIADKAMHDLTGEKSVTDEILREVLQRQKRQFQSNGKWIIDGDKMIQVIDDGELNENDKRVRLEREKFRSILDEEERRQKYLQRTIEEYNWQYRKHVEIIKAHREEKKRLEDELKGEKSTKKKLYAKLLALRDKEKTKQAPGIAESEKLLRELTKLQMERDEMACQLREEKQERDRVQQTLEAEKASLAKKLEKEESDKAELSAQLIALQKTLREKEELNEKIRTDRDDLKSQLRDEKEGRLRDNEDAVREKLSVEQRLQAEKASLADQLERERSDKTKLSAQFIALQKTLEEKEEAIELQQKQNDADSERLHGEIRKLEMDRDELTFQLRNEKEGHRSLLDEAASLADQLKRENSDKKELSAKLIALQKTVIAKEETFELQQKKNDEDFEKLRGEVRKIRTDRDDLESQLRQEREGRGKERQDAVRERSNAVQSYEKQVEDMKERHRIETNRLKADVVAEAAALKRQRDKSLEHYFKAEEMQWVLFLGSTRMLRSAWPRTVKWSNYQTQIDRARSPSATAISSSTHTT